MIYFTNRGRNLRQPERAQAKLILFSYLWLKAKLLCLFCQNIASQFRTSLFDVNYVWINMNIILNKYPGKVLRLNLTIQSLQSLQFHRVYISQYHWTFKFLSYVIILNEKFWDDNSQFSRSSNNKNSFSICYGRVTMSWLLQVTKLGPASIGCTEFCNSGQVATTVPTSKYYHTVW